MKNNEGGPGSGSTQSGTPTSKLPSGSINVGGDRDGSVTDHPTLVPKVGVTEGRKMAFSLKDVALPPRSTEPYKDVVGTLAYRNARKNEFVRVRADPEWKAQIGTILNLAREPCLVGPQVMAYLEQERLVTKVDVFTLMAKDSKDIFLSGIGVKDPSQKENSWNSSRRRAYEMAETSWIRIVSNHDTQSYIITEALGDLPEPVWPDDKIPDLEFALNRVFENRFVDSMSHDVIKGLEGRRLS